MKELRFTIGKNIRTHRTNLCLTQEKAAEKCGLPFSYYERLESKNPPNIQVNTLQRIAKALKTTPGKLIE